MSIGDLWDYISGNAGGDAFTYDNSDDPHYNNFGVGNPIYGGNRNTVMPEADAAISRANLRQSHLEGSGSGAAANANRWGSAVAGTGAIAQDTSNAYQAQGAQDYQRGLGARSQTMDALGRLQNFYQQGPGPSAAEQQLRMGQQQNMGNALALARSGRGAGAGAAAQRNAIFANAAGNQQTNQQAALLRAQEGQAWRGQQLNAMGLEQGTLGNVRGQDIAGMQNANATGLGYGQLGQGYQDLAAKYRLGGAATQLGYEGLANQAGQFGDTLRNQILGQQLNADTAKYGADKGVSVGMANVNQREDAANTSFLGTIVGGAIAASDIRAKKNIREAEASSSLRDVFGSKYEPAEAEPYGREDIVDPWAEDRRPDVGAEQERYIGSDLRPAQRGTAEGTSQLDEAYARQSRDVGPRFDLRPAQAYSYEYKNPAAVGAGPGRYVGPMAQDLEKTPAGASAVVDTPRGKAVDTGRLALVNSSAISETQRKQDEQASKLQELYDLLDMGNARASRNVGARR